MSRSVLLASVLAGLLCAAAATSSPPDSLAMSADSALVRDLAALDEEDEAAARVLWETADLIAPKTAPPSPGFPAPHAAHLRLRTSAPSGGANPAQLLRAEAAAEGWLAGVLAARDEGESDPLDPGRFWLMRDTGTLRLLAGDVAVTSPLGWAAATAPAWPASTSPLAPLARRDETVAPHRSSEEGRGLRGAAVRWHSRQGIEPEVAGWIGTADYDARRDGSALRPYATQGDHAGARDSVAHRLGEVRAGARLSGLLPGRGLRLGLMHDRSRFSEAVVSEDPAARFRFGGRDVTVTGASLVRNGDGLRLRTELVRQDHGAWGGALHASAPLLRRLRIGGGLWRATLGYAPLHSRPDLAFGSDPAGRTGGQAGLDWRGVEGRTASLLLALDRREAHGGSAEELRGRLAALGRAPLPGGLRGDLRMAWNVREGPGSPAHHRVTLRGHLWTGDDALHGGLRLQGVRSTTGEGFLAGLHLGGRGTGALGMESSLVYLGETGRDALLTVVEPSAPGLFPVRVMGGRRLRAALRLDLRTPGGARLWIAARAEHRLDGAGGESATLRAGVEWRMTGMKKGETNG